MKDFLQNTLKLSSWFRSCCICNLSTAPINWLCSHCWRHLHNLYLSPQDMIREQNGLVHIRLFDWDSENDMFVRLFLQSLKRGGPNFIFKKLIMDFLHRIIQIYPLPTDAVLVPAPSDLRYRGHGYDHASCLASCFSHVSGLQLCNPLLRDIMENQKQKQKTHVQRKTLQFFLKKDISLDKVIFVDDILTTGVTSSVAYKVLKKPQKFIIFTLTWRRPNFS